MRADIIDAIMNFVQNPVTELVSCYQGKNRANNAGDALEEYVKDMFANSFNLSETERMERISRIFSYLGNNSNPPDAMLSGGDAIEVKKIETDNGQQQNDDRCWQAIECHRLQFAGQIVLLQYTFN